jgi:DNA-directed RNA polymerase specialized sigma24 family protein/CheY-like chemotaxis protein
MSVAATISPHLPYLRRFARALTGSQASGDAYVVATLEAVVGGQSVLAPGLDARVALYRVFLRIWGSLPMNHDVAAGSDAEASDLEAADRNLAAISALPRVAFLLHSVEGFSTEEIAGALDRPAREVAELIDRAGREIAAQISTDVLIIEDEPVIAIDLETLVEDLGHRVIGIASTHAEAVAAAAGQSPGLVLADIRLADGSSGLEAVNDILGSTDVPVIFITAYPERLLTGERPEPTFLITKPFRGDTVKAVISQALFFDRRASRTPAPGLAATD